MKNIFFLSLLTLMSFQIFAQDPDVMKISIKDTLNNLEDCVLNVEFYRKDKGTFVFPKKYSIGDDMHDTDLMIFLQRREKNGKYVSFHCNQSPPGAPALQSDPIVYEKNDRFNILDSLEGLLCIEKGNYRLKVDYNKRRADGKLDAPNIILSSNWVKFYVSSDRIITSRYIISRLKEEINKN